VGEARWKAQLPLHRGGLIQQSAGVIEQDRTIIGQAEAARGAMKQPGAEMLFQLTESGGSRPEWLVLISRATAETSRFRRPERTHAVRRADP